MEPKVSIPCPLLPILGHVNPVHANPLYLSNIYFNIIHLDYVLVLLVVSFSLAFPPMTYTLSSPPYSCYMLCPSHSPWIHRSNYTWRRVQVKKLLIMQFPTPSRHFIHFFFFFQTFSSAPCSQTPSVCLRQQIGNPIYIYVYEIDCFCGQSSWLQIQRSGDSRAIVLIRFHARLLLGFFFITLVY
jgi:hypothetical protein